MNLDNYDKYRDEYQPEPQGRRVPKYEYEGLYQQAYEDDNED